MGSTWQVIAHHEAAALERFLAASEPASVVMSEKLRHGRLDRTLRNGGRFYYLPDAAVVYHGPGGFFYTAGFASALRRHGARIDLQDELRRATGSFVRLHSIMGNREDVELLADSFASTPRHSIDYALLSLDWRRFPPPDSPPDPGLRIVQPSPSEWRRLLQLQIAYEVEEVLLPGRSPSLSTSKTSLTHSLNTQLVLVAVYRGEAIARVATNARGYAGDQLGGVFTDPAWRGKGVARWLMTHLLTEMQKTRRNASLFVKLDNEAAQALYRSLNFLFESDFRISYYL